MRLYRNHFLHHTVDLEVLADIVILQSTQRRNRMRRERGTDYFFMLLSCLAVTLCFVSITTGASDIEKHSETKDRRVVAKVNGKPIYEDQLAPGVDKGLKKFKKYGMKKDSSDLVKRLARKTLNKVIDHELISQESQKLKIKDVDKKVEGKLQAMRKKYQTEERLDNYLKMKGITIEELKGNFKKRVYLDEYLKIKGISEPEIPEEDIKSFYDSSPKAYSREETIKVSHILIKTEENAGPEGKEKTWKKAEKIRKEILGGKDFAEMAKNHSECNSASGGGSLRYIKRGYMPEEFEKVAFTLKIGAVSEVVETKFGYHIIKVFEKTPEGIAPYQEVKGFIKKFLQEDESKKKLAEHLAKLKDKAKIEIFINESQTE